MSKESEVATAPQSADAGTREGAKTVPTEHEPDVGKAVTEDTEAPPAEPEASVGPGAEQSPEELVRLLQEAQSKADQYWDKVLRLQAEQENLRKRSAREVENAHKYGLERFLTELLPVKDSLELGIAAASDEAVDVGKVREGVDLTLKMLNGALEKFGAAEIDPLNEPFDPQVHQAMTVQEAQGKPSGTVVAVVQKGCLLNGRVVRPAMVIVSK
jgi:molecular chaperone GrpE